ncbi:MAG: hypothetical protein ABI867_36120 [Kofleriaceae bacterium]
MKKMFIVALIVSAATIAACGGKKKPAPTGPTGPDTGSATMPGSGDMGSGSAATPDGAGSGSAM